MYKLIAGIACVLLLVIGLYWWSMRDNEPPMPQQSNQSSSIAPQKNETSRISTAKPHISPPTRPPTIPIVEQEVTLTVEEQEQLQKQKEEKMNTAAVRQFVYDLRTTLVHIGRALAIEEGKYNVDESEAIPSLQSEMEVLSDGYAELKIEHLEEPIGSLLAELFAQVKTLMQTLSSPPTLGELQRGDVARKSLQKKADTLLSLLQNI